MTEERFRKLSFKAGMAIDYFQRGEAITCTLLAINFENECVQLLPIDSEKWEVEEFWTSIKFIDLPKRKIKVIN